MQVPVVIAANFRAQHICTILYTTDWFPPYPENGSDNESRLAKYAAETSATPLLLLSLCDVDLGTCLYSLSHALSTRSLTSCCMRVQRSMRCRSLQPCRNGHFATVRLVIVHTFGGNATLSIRLGLRRFHILCALDDLEPGRSPTRMLLPFKRTNYFRNAAVKGCAKCSRVIVETRGSNLDEHTSTRRVPYLTLNEIMCSSTREWHGLPNYAPHSSSTLYFNQTSIDWRI